MDKRLAISILPIFFVLLLAHIPSIEARQTTTHYPVLVIEYNQVCQTLITHHINSTCPHLSVLKKYDTSDKHVSGKFIKQGDDFIRTQPQLKNHWLYYQKQIVCVVCEVPLDKPDLFSVIFIKPSGFVYTLQNDNVTKGSYKFYKDRYSTPDCITTTIGSDKNFEFLLNDTIHYVLSGCKITSLNINQTSSIKNDIPIQYDNPFSTLHYKKQVDDMKKNGIPNCITIKCTPNKDPYAKKGWTK